MTCLVMVPHPFPTNAPHEDEQYLWCRQESPEELDPIDDRTIDVRVEYCM